MENQAKFLESDWIAKSDRTELTAAKLAIAEELSYLKVDMTDEMLTSSRRRRDKTWLADANARKAELVQATKQIDARLGEIKRGTSTPKAKKKTAVITYLASDGCTKTSASTGDGRNILDCLIIDTVDAVAIVWSGIFDASEEIEARFRK